jgi:hypothetical protein
MHNGVSRQKKSKIDNRCQEARGRRQAANSASGDTTMSHEPASTGQPVRPAGRRSRQDAGRHRRVEFTLTDAEFDELDAAAQRAGLARGAYAAQAALATARGGTGAADGPLREALAELIRSAGLVRRAGVNLNQAVAKLNSTGQRSGDLLPYAAESTRRARRLDAAADELRRRLR